MSIQQSNKQQHKMTISNKHSVLEGKESNIIEDTREDEDDFSVALIKWVREINEKQIKK